MADLGKLVKVDLREAWRNEAGDFTPWLAQEENIKLLGETIAIDLEVETQEQEVGPFRADILCKDTANNKWVLVENQLEKTDHLHLGQLMTYAAGLDAVVIVWIAEKFTEEHRAALDWLNEITEEGINFFGLEIELWKVDDSSPAPKFNIVSKPNEWSKAIKATAVKGEMTKTETMQLKYWTAFTDIMKTSGTVVRVPKPAAQGWLVFSIGRTGFQILTRVSNRGKQIGVYLNISGPHRLKYYDILCDKYKNTINEVFEMKPDWRRLPEKKVSHIELYYDCDPTEQKSWSGQHKWLKESVEKLYEICQSIIKKLDLMDYLQSEEEGDGNQS